MTFLHCLNHSGPVIKFLSGVNGSAFDFKCLAKLRIIEVMFVTTMFYSIRCNVRSSSQLRPTLVRCMSLALLKISSLFIIFTRCGIYLESNGSRRIELLVLRYIYAGLIDVSDGRCSDVDLQEHLQIARTEVFSFSGIFISTQTE